MSEDRMKNISIALLAITALVLLLFKKQDDKIRLASFVALALIFGLVLMFPFTGFLLSIPIFLVVWFDHQKEIWDWWGSLKNATLNIGGDKK